MTLRELAAVLLFTFGGIVATSPQDAAWRYLVGVAMVGLSVLLFSGKRHEDNENPEKYTEE